MGHSPFHSLYSVVALSLGCISFLPSWTGGVSFRVHCSVSMSTHSLTTPFTPCAARTPVHHQHRYTAVTYLSSCTPMHVYLQTASHYCHIRYILNRLRSAVTTYVPCTVDKTRGQQCDCLRLLAARFRSATGTVFRSARPLDIIMLPIYHIRPNVVGRVEVSQDHDQQIGD